jgi:xylan 1,4-beta-xylosidase
MRTTRIFASAVLALLNMFAVASGRSRGAAGDDKPFAVNIRVDAAAPGYPLRPVWRFFGADEPNYAYMKDGRKLLGELGGLKPSEVYFRTHNLLNSGTGAPALKWGSTNAYTEDSAGRPVYDWRLVDLIFDTYLERGVRPYAQIGFMPKALSSRPDPYQHEWRPGFPYDEIYTGWAYPPRDYSKWGELVRSWAQHCLERYGRAEVDRWYWETWNEANIGYWRGTRAEFFKLHDFAVDGVRRAIPSARVGGPDMAGSGGGFLEEFLEHCLRGTNAATGRPGTPLDFISFHAKGAPRYVDGHVQMGIAPHLRTVEQGFRVVASYPELKAKPIVIGESDPEGCAACQGPQLAYRNGTMYSSYTAESFARIQDLAGRHGVNLEGILTWAFTFEDQPYFAGFRQLAGNGINLPVLNVFRMFSRMKGRRLPVESSAALPLDAVLRDGVRGAPDVSAFASREERRVSVLSWHYHDDDLEGPAAAAELTVSGLPSGRREVTVSEYRIDEGHGNSYAAWKRMGSPVAPSREEYARLEEASRLDPAVPPRRMALRDGSVTVGVSLPRQAVTLVVLDWD